MLDSLSSELRKQLEEVDRLFAEANSKVSTAFTQGGMVHPEWFAAWVQNVHAKLMTLHFTTMINAPILDFLLGSLDKEKKLDFETIMSLYLDTLKEKFKAEIEESKIKKPGSNLVLPR